MNSTGTAASSRVAARAAILLATAVAAGGCSFTEVAPEARDVEVLSAARTANCDRVGETQVSVAHKVGFIARGDKAIQNDLDNLARNSAADMGGDTVTRIGEPRNGKQTYRVYDCVDE